MPFTVCLGDRCFEIPVLVERTPGPDPDPRTVAIKDAWVLTTIAAMAEGLSQDVRREVAGAISASAERVQAALPGEMTLRPQAMLARAG
jgi:hypothetical protein